MAKDAKGHGSDGRGSMSVADRHQHNIARDTVKNPLKGTFLGGPNAAEAEAMLRGKFGYSDSAISTLKGDGGPALDTGHPKSAGVPVHGGAMGRSEYASQPRSQWSGAERSEVNAGQRQARSDIKDKLNAWGQTPETAKGARKQLRQDRAQRSFNKSGRSLP